VPPYTEDRFFAPDIEAAKSMIASAAFARFVPPGTLPSLAGK
jgi:hypothetical protein